MYFFQIFVKKTNAEVVHESKLTSTFFIYELWRYARSPSVGVAPRFAVSQVVAAQNLPENPSTASLGLIHIPGGYLPQPRAPIRPPEGQKTPSKSTVIPWQGFTQLKSSRSGPKFDRQSIHRILGPHPRLRGRSPPALTPGAPITPPKGWKTPPKSTVFP